MSLVEIWVENDFVVRTLMVALAVVFIMVLEKVYGYFVAFKSLKELETIESLDEIDTLKDPFMKNTLKEIKEFDTDSKELFHSFVNVKIDMYEQHSMKYITTIGIVAVLAPMLGLIGTFIGVWHVFEGIGDIRMSDPSLIAKGIKEVLIDTMSGLIVAVISMIFYKMFEHISGGNVSKFEEKIYHLLRVENAKKS